MSETIDDRAARALAEKMRSVAYRGIVSMLRRRQRLANHCAAEGIGP